MSYVTDLPASAKITYAPKATFSGDESGWRAEMGWVCDYADRDAFLSIVAGTQENVGNNITRIVPLRHPHYTNMLAYTVKAEDFGHDPNATVNKVNYPYTNTRITVGFKNWPFPIVGSQPFLTIRLRHGSEAITIPQAAYKFASTGQILQGVDAAVIVPTTVYTITLYQCPNLNDTLITTIQANPVNSDICLGIAPGYLRFDGADTEIVQTVTGMNTYTKTLSFTYRAAPWNQVLNSAGVWEAPVTVSGGANMYGTSALSQLFQ